MAGGSGYVDSSDKLQGSSDIAKLKTFPIITLVDLPGYLPGVDQEHAGVFGTWGKSTLCV